MTHNWRCDNERGEALIDYVLDRGDMPRRHINPNQDADVYLAASAWDVPELATYVRQNSRV